MRLGWVGALCLVVGFFGCATAESIAPDGTSGYAGATASGGGGAGGKGDNPNDGGAGGVSGSGNSGGVGGDTGGVGGDTGGAPSGGGVAGSGGTIASGGTGSGCATGQKKCGGVCIPPSPGVGCSATDCTPCPTPPSNANSVCSGTLCDFTCVSGYTKSGSTCVSTGSGGGGGTGGGGAGTGGTGGGSGCPAPCTASDPTSQFLCAFFCAASGKSIGICAPVLNCCACSG